MRHKEIATTELFPRETFEKPFGVKLEKSNTARNKVVRFTGTTKVPTLNTIQYNGVTLNMRPVIDGTGQYVFENTEDKAQWLISSMALGAILNIDRSTLSKLHSRSGSQTSRALVIDSVPVLFNGGKRVKQLMWTRDGLGWIINNSGVAANIDNLRYMTEFDWLKSYLDQAAYKNKIKAKEKLLHFIAPHLL